MARRQAELPLSMTTLSTHDTKRSEDTRARISVARGAGAGVDRPPWSGCRTWRRCPTGRWPNLLWQAVAGVWPADRERLQSYARKAAREAGNSTNWTDPDAAFEAEPGRRRRRRLRQPGGAARNWRPSWRLLEPYGASNALGAKLVQLTMPGVPDVYQGTEFWDRSLTDPDNRRPFDFEARQRGPGRARRRRAAGVVPRRSGEAAGHLAGAAPAPGPPGAVHRLRAGARHRPGGRAPARL